MLEAMPVIGALTSRFVPERRGASFPNGVIQMLQAVGDGQPGGLHRRIMIGTVELV